MKEHKLCFHHCYYCYNFDFELSLQQYFQCYHALRCFKMSFNNLIIDFMNFKLFKSILNVSESTNDNNSSDQKNNSKNCTTWHSWWRSRVFNVNWSQSRKWFEFFRDLRGRSLRVSFRTIQIMENNSDFSICCSDISFLIMFEW